MFDTSNEQKRVELHEEKPKAGAEEAKFKRTIIGLGVGVGVLVVALILAAAIFAMRQDSMKVIDDGGIHSSSEDEGGGIFGNPGKLTDVDPITPEQLEDEYASRPNTTPSDGANFERTMTNFLTVGDFDGLAAYLTEQGNTYGTPADEYAESMDDYGALIPMWRSDVQAALNIVNKSVDDYGAYFQNFSNPEILAATVAYAPLSTKLNAFKDYSALILPAADNGENIKLVEYEYGKKSSEMLSKICDMSGEIYMNVKSYDMEIKGHPVRVTVVMNSMGYYDPWSVQDLGGGLNPRIWNKTTLNDSGADINYRFSIDDVYFLSPPSELPSKDEHPDWFDEFGVYIGPIGGENATVEPPSTETPLTETPAGEDGAEASAETETPAESQATGAPAAGS